MNEIDQLRSDVGSDAKIRLRAQTDIFDILNEAFEDLNKQDSSVSLHQAASKVKMAHKRALQAQSQGQLLPWLPILIGLILGGALALAAYIMIDSKNAVFSPESVWPGIVLGAVLWGVVGSATDGLRELHTRVARQELDLNRLVWYLVHPVIGAAIGGILVFVVNAGLLALTGENLAQETSSSAAYNPALVYALAAMAGFGQRQMIQYLRETLANMLHIKREDPEEAG
ncbi:hypothetical protein ACFLWZ_05550 [Chloroflexota bacterium]